MNVEKLKSEVYNLEVSSIELNDAVKKAKKISEDVRDIFVGDKDEIKRYINWNLDTICIKLDIIQDYISNIANSDKEINNIMTSMFKLIEEV